MTPDDRFWSKVNKTDSCWEWTSSKNSSGYGYFGISSDNVVRAHRFSYEHYKGKIPKGLTIDHLCRNRKCVNPEHLEAVTQQENIRRGETGLHNRIKSHCQHGHGYTKENTYVYYGKRNCRICRSKYGLEYRKNNPKKIKQYNQDLQYKKLVVT